MAADPQDNHETPMAKRDNRFALQLFYKSVDI
jgi:hypothetical protein